MQGALGTSDMLYSWVAEIGKRAVSGGAYMCIHEQGWHMANILHHDVCLQCYTWPQLLHNMKIHCLQNVGWESLSIFHPFRVSHFIIYVQSVFHDTHLVSNADTWTHIPQPQYRLQQQTTRAQVTPLLHSKTQCQVLDRWFTHERARDSSPKVPPGTQVAVLDPMGLEKPPTAYGMSLLSMAKSGKLSVLVKSLSELAAGYYFRFYIQALTKCLLLLAIVWVWQHDAGEPPQRQLHPCRVSH